VPEAVKDEREAGGQNHVRHSGLVWDVRAGKSLDQSYVAANNAANKVARVDAQIDARSENARADNEIAAGSETSKNKKMIVRKKNIFYSFIAHFTQFMLSRTF
jgi:hypothetical protein